MEFIEFIGNPGCGKSTIANKLCDYLSRDHKVFNLGESININKKLLYTFFFIVLHPVKFISLLNSIIKTKQPNSKTLFKMVVNMSYLYGVINKLNSKNYDYVVLDQGLIQGLWSIDLEANLSMNRDSTIKKLPLNYSLIYIDVDNKSILERLNGRESNFSRFEKNMDKIDLERSNSKLQELYNCFESRKFIFNNNNAIEITKLVDMMKQKGII